MVATDTLPRPQCQPMSVDFNEQELSQRLQSPATREAAFAQIVDLYKERVYFLVRRMVIDHSQTDDLVQDIFIRVWQGLDKFRGESQIFTWIYRIATNECLTYLAKRKRWLSLFGRSHEWLESLEAQKELRADQIQLALQKALLRLPEKQRIVFLMRYYDEMPYEQMSEILSTSVGALKASYHFAVKKIEEELAKFAAQL